jgi:serine phosphatase RsbU (regulator of sigma subunit)
MPPVREEPDDRRAEAARPPGLRFLLDGLAAEARLRWSPLGTEMHAFAERFEAAAREGRIGPRGGQYRIAVEFESEGPTGEMDPLAINGWTRRLAHFLTRLGVRTVVCAETVDAPQMMQVFTLLWQVRHCVSRKKTNWRDCMRGRGAACAALTGGGAELASVTARLDAEAGELVIAARDREHALSGVVQQYKQRFPRLRDHRAFRRAAPVYAFAAFAVAFIPICAAVLFDFPAWVEILEAVCVGVLMALWTYIFFLVVAAEEYDKERQSRELARRHSALEQLYSRVQADLQTARGIQRNLLPDPRKRPFPRHVAFAHLFLPEMAVGGDLYDLKAIDGRRVAVLLADVAGHGMSAAFITALIKTTIEFGRADRGSPKAMLAELNSVIERLTPTGSFAATMYFVYDVETRRLTYSNAGHNPVPIVVRRRSHEVDFLDENVNLLVGVNPDMTYDETEIDLDVGDKLVLATDGIIDTVDATGEQRYGAPWLHRLLTQYAELSAGELKEKVVADLLSFSGGAERPDDQTLVIMEVLK